MNKSYLIAMISLLVSGFFMYGILLDLKEETSTDTIFLKLLGLLITLFFALFQMREDLFRMFGYR